MPSNKVNMISGLFTCYSFEKITVGATVKTLSNPPDSNGDTAKRVVITVETAQIRYRYDGGNPSATSGHLLNPMDALTLRGQNNISNFKAIKKGTASGVIFVSYEK